MHLRRFRLRTLILLTVVVGLAGRMAWQASQTAVGWEYLWEQGTTNTARLVGVDRPELSAQEPEGQARLWLAETERVVRSQDTPKIAAGAAWLLDAPQTGFIVRHYRENKGLKAFPELPFAVRQEIDYDSVSRAVGRFEDTCRERCFDSIERAAAHDPKNVEMWRARALLLFQCSVFGGTFEPRRTDWLEILEQCAAHDPKNALYDYLAAVRGWTTSAIVRWDGSGSVLELRDQDAFEQANRQFAVGLSKPRLMFGTEANSATLAFLGNSSLSKMDQIRAAENSGIGNRAFLILIDLLRWQQRRSEVARRAENTDDAEAMLRMVLAVASQSAGEGNPYYFIVEPLTIRRFALANLVELVGQTPERFDADEAEKLKTEYRNIRLELEIVDKAGQNWKLMDQPRHGCWQTVAVFAAIVAQPLAEILLLLALFIATFAWRCGRRPQFEPPRVGILIHVAAWTLGLGLSYVVFGMCPAGIVSASIQTWFVRGLFTLPFLFAFIGLLYVLNRTFRVGYGQLIALLISSSIPWAALCCRDFVLDLLVAVVGGLQPIVSLLLAVAVLAAGCIIGKADLSFLRRADITSHRKRWLAFVLLVVSGFTVPWAPSIPRFVEANLETRVWVPSRSWNEAPSFGFAAGELRREMHLEQHAGLWSLLQWHAYSGMYVGFSLSLLLLIVWCSVRRSCSTSGGFRQIIRSEKREYLWLIGTTAARSLVLVGVCALLAYLAAVPAAIDERESWYQRHYARLADPAAARRELDAEIAAVRNDPALMLELRQKAEKGG